MDKKKIIFIVGNSRSGTTLIARILSCHRDVHILHETHFIEEFYKERTQFEKLDSKAIKLLINKMVTIQKKDYYNKSQIEEHIEADEVASIFEESDDRSFENLIRIYFDYIAASFGKSIPGDQTPRHIFYVSLLKTMFPDAIFINMIRDPRAVLLSQKYKWKALSKKGVPFFETARTFCNYHPIPMSFMWKKGIEHASNVNKNIKEDAWIDIKFEDLVADPEGILKNTCAILGIQYDRCMLDVRVSMSSMGTREGHRGIVKEVSDVWFKKLSNLDIYFSEKINKNLILKLNYPLTGRAPSLASLLVYYLILPVQLAAIFLLNYNRMGNPAVFLKKRFAKNR